MTMLQFTHFETIPESDLWQIIIGHREAPLPIETLYLLNTLTTPYDIALLTKLNLKQAKKIAAVLELTRRIRHSHLYPKKTLNTPIYAYHYLKDMISADQEIIRAVYLDSQLQVLHDQIIAIGSLNKAQAHVREILRPAFLVNAYTFILAHNHPSGDQKPSDEDIQFTKQIATIANCLGIPLQDHIVIANAGFSSIRQMRPECF